MIYNMYLPCINYTTPVDLKYQFITFNLTLASDHLYREVFFVCIMDTTELQKYLNTIHPSLQYNVYAANRLPIYTQNPTYIISNLDPDTKPGSHWVAIHIDINGLGQYFDSYGRPPKGYHQTFLKKNSRQWDFNTYRLQNDWTSVCGEYCLLYLYYKYNGNTMSDFIRLFNMETLYNDILLYNMFKSNFIDK